MIAATVSSIITALAAPMPIWLRVKVYAYMNVRGQLGRVARPAAGQRDHQVVALDRQVREDHERRQEHRAAAAE